MTELSGFVTTQEKDASSEIREGLLVYGEDQLMTKFPSSIDGLKDVTRRILWFSRGYNEPKSLNKVLGEIGDFHTGGDRSIYEATVRLAQDFMMDHHLMQIEGKSGEYYDPEGAAAPRYLKAKVSEFAQDVYFNRTNLNTLPMVPTKEFTALEPKYLIPCIPMALYISNLTVGFGFKSLTPMVALDDVCNLTMEFAEYYQHGGFEYPAAKDTAKYLIPAFPIKNLIKNRQELLLHYQRGEYDWPIALEGWAELNGSNITLRAVPYGENFKGVTTAIRHRLMDKKDDLGQFITSASQFSSSEAEFSMDVKRSQNPFVAFDQIRRTLKFSKNFRPIYSYTREGRVLPMNPITLTYMWYMERRSSIAGGLKYRLDALVNRRMMDEAMLVVSGHTQDVVKISETSDTTQEAALRLHKRFFPHLTRKQAGMIADAKLSVLNRKNKADIQADIEQIDVEIRNLDTAAGKLDELIYTDAEYIKKKYQQPKLTRYSDEFIGYVQFGDLGVIQFFDLEDMYELLNTKGWPNTLRKTIHFYDRQHPRRFIIKGNNVQPLLDASKEITCKGIVCYPLSRADYTLVISDQGGSSVVSGEVSNVASGFTLCPIRKNFYAIHRNGMITEDTISNYAMRKNVTKGVKTNVIYGLPDNTHEVAVFHMNTKDLNTLRCDIILTKDGLGQLKTVPAGKMYILGIYPITTRELYLNIPTECRKGLTLEYLCVKHLSEIAKLGDHQRIQLMRTTDKTFKLTRNQTVRTLFTLDLVKSK